MCEMYSNIYSKSILIYNSLLLDLLSSFGFSFSSSIFCCIVYEILNYLKIMNFWIKDVLDVNNP
jgi:hypothetical protein